MNPEPNNNHWLGTWVACLLSACSWVGTHIGPVSGGFAILAAILSMRASRATRKLRDDQLKNPRRYWAKQEEEE